MLTDPGRQTEDQVETTHLMCNNNTTLTFKYAQPDVCRRAVTVRQNRMFGHRVKFIFIYIITLWWCSGLEKHGGLDQNKYLYVTETPGNTWWCGLLAVWRLVVMSLVSTDTLTADITSWTLGCRFCLLLLLSVKHFLPLHLNLEKGYHGNGSGFETRSILETETREMWTRGWRADCTTRLWSGRARLGSFAGS